MKEPPNYLRLFHASQKHIQDGHGGPINKLAAERAKDVLTVTWMVKGHVVLWYPLAPGPSTSVSSPLISIRHVLPLN